MKCKRKNHKPCVITRRGFFKTLSGVAVSTLVFGSCSTTSDNNDNDNEQQVLGPRISVPNPYVNNEGQPILVCVKGNNFSNMLHAGMDVLGGFNRLINNNQSVLIKPNLNHSDPFPGISSPGSIESIVREVNQVTLGNVYVGDMGYETTVYEYLGLEEYVSNAGGILLNFSGAYPVRQNFWESTKPNFCVYRDVYDAPVIINTCCLKRHHTASFTCSIKCNVGCITGPGASGTRNHIHYQSGNFMNELSEIAALIKPELTIVDARSILTIGGPRIAEGVVVDGVNRVIICGDPVATDVYCAKLMEEYDSSFSINSIEETLNHAVELGLGTRDLNQVEIIETQV